MAVGVPMPVVRVSVDGIGYWRLAAAVDGGAVGHFELNGGVVDAEVVAKLVVQALEDCLALGERHLDDLHMACKRVRLRGEAPYV